jgi:uncharacterized protein YjiS (DUF1127 family)
MATTPSLPRENALDIVKVIRLFAGRLFKIVEEWRQRSRSRRELLTLDARDLCDVRLTRCDAVAEGNKPFWKK